MGKLSMVWFKSEVYDHYKDMSKCEIKNNIIYFENGDYVDCGGGYDYFSNNLVFGMLQCDYDNLLQEHKDIWDNYKITNDKECRLSESEYKRIYLGKV